MKAPKKAPVRRFEFSTTTEDLLKILNRNVARVADNDFASGFVDVTDISTESATDTIQAVFIFPEKNIPVAAVKKKLAEWILEYKKVNGRNPSKQAKAEAKADIIAKLELHIPTTFKSVYTIFRCVGTDLWEAFILTSSEKIVDSFSMFLPDGWVRGMSAYLDALDAVGGEGLDYNEDSDYRDFLTWLLYSAGSNSFKEFGDYAVTIGDCVSVADDDNFTTCVVSGDFIEAKSSIFGGKRVFNFEFAIEYNHSTEGQVVKLLADTSADIQSLTFNCDDVGMSFGGRFLSAYDDFMKFMHCAVHEFIKLRLDTDAWNDYNKVLKEWARGEICVRAFDGV